MDKNHKQLILGITIGFFFTGLVVLLLLASYEGASDNRYAACMIKKAHNICTSMDMVMVSTSAWEPHVICQKFSTIDNVLTVTPLKQASSKSYSKAMSLEEINDCWERSGSVVFFLGHSNTNKS